MKNKKTKLKKLKNSETIDMIDEEDEVIGTMTLNEMKKNKILHREFLIFILNPNDGIFITKNLDKKDKNFGKYDISCRGIVKSNETYEESAEKEMKKLYKIDVPLTFIRRIRYNDGNTNYLAHIYAISYDEDIKINGNKKQSGRFMSESEIKKLICSGKFYQDAKAIIEKYLDEIKEMIIK